jgi:hypothetical protein
MSRWSEERWRRIPVGARWWKAIENSDASEEER